MKAISSLKTLGDKMDYIDTYFEPGTWLCTRCGMPRPASESKCQAMTKAGYVDVDGRALWTQCTGSQVSSWGGLFRAADSRPECPRTLLEYTRAGEKGRLSGGSRYAREVAKIELREGEREGQVEPDRMALVSSVLEGKAKITIDRQRQREAADLRAEVSVAEGAYRWPCWNCWS